MTRNAAIRALGRPGSRRLNRFLLLAIVVTALGLRVGFAVANPPDGTESDASAYHGVALNLIAGNGYSLDGSEPTRVRPPTYPVFLAAVYALFGAVPFRAALVQAALGSLTCVLVYLIGRRVFSTRAGLLAAAVAAAYPALVYYDTRILREGFSAALFALCAWLALDLRGRTTRPRLLAFGLLTAAITLCRPELLVPVGALSLLFIWPARSFRRRAVCALLVAAPMAALWGPWTARNYLTFGSVSPVTAGLGSVLWFGNRWAEIDGDYHTPEARARLQQETHRIRQAREAEIDRRFASRAVRDLVRRPDWYAAMVGRKMVMFWRDANGVKKTLPRIHDLLPPLLNTYYYTLLVLAAAAGLAGRRRYPLASRLLGVVLVYMMTYALLHVRNRYRVPVLPVVFVLSAGGFWMLWEMARGAIASRLSGDAPCAPAPSGADGTSGVGRPLAVREGEDA